MKHALWEYTRNKWVQQIGGHLYVIESEGFFFFASNILVNFPEFL